jgi:hypothetical protein
MPKTPEEIAADNDANREQREQLAREANKRRNDALLEARNAIADKADGIKDEEDDLVDLTDEVWDQNDRGEGGEARKKTRAERLAEADADATRREQESLTDEERETAAAADLLREQERLDQEQDDARDAGATDVRKNDKGVTEYRVEVAGAVKWLTLSQLRSQAGHMPDDSDAGRRSPQGDTTRQPKTPSPQTEQARPQAEELAKQEREARRAKLKDLYTRASMGDEEAIEALADMQSETPRVTPEALNRMVDERVDARVEGKTTFDRAVEWFESEDGYARELAAPGFKQKAAQIDVRLANEQPGLNPRQRLDLVGKELRTELKRMREFLGAPAGEGRRTPREPETKLERKRNAPQVPQAAGRTRPEAEPDERETTQEAIARMAASRGQARAIKH